MATGVIIRQKDGTTRQVPYSQLQDVDPFLYSQYVQNVAQPQASLQQTQAATGAEGASAAASSASAERTQAELPAAQQAGQQAQAWNTIQNYFNAQKDQKSGKVSPDVYNQAKSQAASIGIDGDTFDKTFADNYTDPSNINYNTAEDQAARQQYIQTKKGLQSTLDQFAAIPADQKGLFSKGDVAQVPLLGKLLAPQAQEYENSVKALAAQIAPEAGGGSGSGVRVTQTELSQWANLLPSPTKTNQQNVIDLQQLNDRLESKFGKGNGLDPQYLPDSKGNIPNQASGPSFGTEALNFLTGDLQKGAKVIQNYPAALQEGAKEIQQNGILAAPSPKLRAMLTPGATADQFTGNRVLDSIIGANTAANTTQGAAGEVAQVPLVISGIKDLVVGGGEAGQSALNKLLKGGDKSVLEAGIKLANEGSTLRDTAIKAAEDAGSTIDGNNIFKGVQEWAQKAIDTGADAEQVNSKLKAASNFLENKTLTPTQLKGYWDMADQAFKDSGRVGDTVLQRYQGALRDGIRQELDAITNGQFSEGTSQIAQGLAKNKNLKAVADATEKASLKNSLRSPLQKVLGNPIVRTGAGALGAGEFLRVLEGR